MLKPYGQGLGSETIVLFSHSSACPSPASAAARIRCRRNGLGGTEACTCPSGEGFFPGHGGERTCSDAMGAFFIYGISFFQTCSARWILLAFAERSRRFCIAVPATAACKACCLAFLRVVWGEKRVVCAYTALALPVPF